MDTRQVPLPALPAGLRVCPKSSCGLTEPSQHKAYRGELQEEERPSIEAFPILGEAPAAVQPSNRAFHDPAFGQDREALCLIGSLDDRDLEASADPAHAGLKGRPLIAAVGVELEQKRVKAEQGRHHPDTAVTILDVARMHEGVKQQTLRVYKDMALLPFDLFARIVSRRVDRRPPFSALLTLWLSMMAAVGLASRPAFSRHRTYKA